MIPQVSLRPATLDDAAMIFQWRNIPEIVALGASNRLVEWEEHQQWFREVLAGGHALHIILCDGQPAGQVRFDRKDSDTAEVSIYLLPEYTGRGIGVTALTRACQQAFSTLAVMRIEARIRTDNPRSVAAFRKAGFTEQKGAPLPDEIDLNRYFLERNTASSD